MSGSGPDAYIANRPVADIAGVLDDRIMKLIVTLASMAGLLAGCEKPEMRIGGTEASQCEAAYAGSHRTQSRSDFLSGCASARWVAVCADGSASFSDDSHSVCENGEGVAVWHRVVDG